MSVTGISQNTTVWQPVTRPRAPASPSQDTDIAATRGGPSFPTLPQPSDSITVNLPGGLSIGMVHLGSPLSADEEKQMADSMAQLAAKFIGSQGANPTPADKPAAWNEGNGRLTSGESDLVHIDTPNGVSFDIRHWSQGNPTEAEQNAISDQLARTAAELADAMKAYLKPSSAQGPTDATAPA